MKYILPLILIVIVIASCIVYTLLHSKNSPTIEPGGQATSTVNSLPASTTSEGGQKISLADRSGAPLVVRDFRLDPQVVVPPNNPGHYFLSGGLDPTESKSPYSTYYDEVHNLFNVTLRIEPLGATRRAAETTLQKQLGLSDTDMCRLTYTVGVPHFVSAEFAGKELGFSFCPGSVELP